MAYYNTAEFGRFFQDPPHAKRLESYRRGRAPQLPPPVPLGADGQYHGLEFINAGTNSVRIFLASQYLSIHLPEKIYDAEHLSLPLSRHGPIFHDLALSLSNTEPCLAGVDGPALFWMYDRIVDNEFLRLKMKVDGEESLETQERRRWLEEGYGWMGEFEEWLVNEGPLWGRRGGGMRDRGGGGGNVGNGANAGGEIGGGVGAGAIIAGAGAVAPVRAVAPVIAPAPVRVAVPVRVADPVRAAAPVRVADPVRAAVPVRFAALAEAVPRRKKARRAEANDGDMSEEIPELRESMFDTTRILAAAPIRAVAPTIPVAPVIAAAPVRVAVPVEAAPVRRAGRAKANDVELKKEEVKEEEEREREEEEEDEVKEEVPELRESTFYSTEILAHLAARRGTKRQDLQRRAEQQADGEVRPTRAPIVQAPPPTVAAPFIPDRDVGPVQNVGTVGRSAFAFPAAEPALIEPAAPAGNIVGGSRQTAGAAGGDVGRFGRLAAGAAATARAARAAAAQPY
ncbi:hypothetical protein BGW39_006560 [Mortierella sp. 14UC]|nr:hypothetical protein BGW39_006560 [Mortierella sp. 14UC]